VETAAPSTNSITIVTSEAEKNQFLRFPYQHYSGHPWWVPPLLMEQKKLLNLKKNPFYKNAEVAFFLAEHNGTPAGRIAAIIDHRYNEHHNAKTGFFGFFECIDNQATASLLFRVAEDWLRKRGMTDVLGPANPSMMDEIGILIDGFEKHPAILMPYNYDYYGRLLEGAGYDKAMDMYAYLVTQDSVDRERALRAVEIVKKRLPGISVRPINLKKIRDEVKIIRTIFNAAWKNNWGYIPLSEEEFDNLAKDLKTIADPDFAHIAELDGEPVAFSVALPDYNQILKDLNGKLLPFGFIKLLLRKKKINKIRTALMGVLPSHQGKGIDVLLHREAIQNGLVRNYYSSEVGWILESNVQMVRVAEKIGGQLDKTYRMFSKDL
jgi:GNAT superfamily N-acetyltransferase